VNLFLKIICFCALDNLDRFVFLGGSSNSLIAATSALQQSSFGSERYSVLPTRMAMLGMGVTVEEGHSGYRDHLTGRSKKAAKASLQKPVALECS
jgi:hypothetical protein